MQIGRLARWYRWIEYMAFGRTLERRRCAFLPLLSDVRRVLILGEGDGRALQRLLEIAPLAEIDVIDSSLEMLALARRRTAGSNRVQFLCQDATTAAWPASHYDAVISLFFLDCFTESDARPLIHRLAQALTPGGTWLISEFAIPARGWPRWHARAVVALMYRFFRIATGLRAKALPPIEKLVQEAGMTRIDVERERAGLVVSEVWVRNSANPPSVPSVSV